MPETIGRILFIRPGGIGDAVLLIPTIRALRQALPDVVIEVLVEQRNAGVFALCSGVERVWCYDRPGELLAVLCRRYDVVIDSEQWHRLSAVVARLIRSERKIGFASNERTRLFSHPVDYTQDCYEVESFSRLLMPLRDVEGITDAPFLTVSDAPRRRATELLVSLQQQPFVAISAGASILERRWGGQNFRAVVSALASEGIPSVVVGGMGEAAAGAEIISELGGLNLAGMTSLVESAAVIERSAVLVSSDSGLLHIGVGLGVSTISLFGSGIEKKWAPRGMEHVVLNKNICCSPCTRFGYTPACPVGAVCLQEISVEEVLSAVLRLLRNKSKGTSF